MDATLERVFKKVAEKHKVDISTVADLYVFHQRKIRGLFNELGKQFDSVYIPYICSIDFIKESYERQKREMDNASRLSKEVEECKKSECKD
jgi:hypothetical protein